MNPTSSIRQNTLHFSLSPKMADENSSTSDTNQTITNLAAAVFSPSEEIKQAVYEPSTAPSSTSCPIQIITHFNACRKTAFDLIEKITRCNDELNLVDAIPTKAREENNKKFSYLTDTLEALLEAISPEQCTPNVGLESSLLKKLAQIEQFIDIHQSTQPEKKLGDFFDFWELDLRKIADEIRALPRSGSPLEIIPDTLTRINWAHRLQDDYSVPYTTFYNKVILGIFPEMEGNEEFCDYIGYLINPLAETDITAYAWKRFVDLLGPMEDLHDNVLAFQSHSSFVGNMSRLVAENMLTQYSMAHRYEERKSIIRFSRTMPGSLVVSYFCRDVHGAVNFYHILSSDWKQKGQASEARAFQGELQRSKNISPLDLRINAKLILENLTQPHSRYTSIVASDGDKTPASRYVAFRDDDDAFPNSVASDEDETPASRYVAFRDDDAFPM